MDLESVLTNARVRAVRALRDEDAAQSVVIALWKAIESGNLKGETGTYIRAAINNRKQELLRGKYRDSVKVELDEDTLPEHNNNTADRDYNRFDAEQLRIIHFLEEGYSVKEIAEALGIHRATLYRRIESMRCDNLLVSTD